MKNKLFKVLCPAVVLLGLASCVSHPVDAPKDEQVAAHAKLEAMDEETANAIKEEIEIVGGDAVYGNVYLPREVDGATIFWRSSNPDVVSYEDDGDMKAGRVTRAAEDTKVTMTAYVEKDGKGAKLEQTINVLQAPAELSEDDFTGYMFTHFIGEGRGAMGEQLYFALADDGFDFNDVNYVNGKLQPALISTVGESGVRDPYIMRSHEGDRFFILATDLSIHNRGGWGTHAGQYASREGSYNLIMWESTDLVDWGEPKQIKVAPDHAGMAWAPEMVYCEETGEYVIISSSSIVTDDRQTKVEGDHIFYVTTRDFVHFSESKPFLMGQPKKGVTTDYADCTNEERRLIIDASVMRLGDTYYCAAKDGDNNEAEGNIRLFKSDTLFDWTSWEKVLDLDELGLSTNGTGVRAFDNSQLEGPELFRFNKEDWTYEDLPEYGLMADRYMNTSLGYLPFKTTNFEDRGNEEGSWSLLNEKRTYFHGDTYRHGSILNLTTEEVERMKEAYPAKA